jgi:hypothetical protein
LLALNTALAALGLNASQLAQVDQNAKLIQDFNPAAFASLLYQLEALAHVSAQPTPAPPASMSRGDAAAQSATSASATVAGTSAAGTTTGITSGTNNAGGFQLQESQAVPCTSSRLPSAPRSALTLFCESLSVFEPP